MQKLEPYFFRTDARGLFCGITRDPWAEVNFVETGANQVRGSHYHKETRELFFIIAGEIQIDIEPIQGGERTSFVARKGDIFIVEPYELHTFVTRSDAQWINMLSKPLDLSNPDFHRPEASP